MNETLYVGQRISHADGKGTITGVNKSGTYTVILDSGTILKDQAREALTAGDSNLHAELTETLVLLAAMRSAQADAERAYEDEYALWLEQNTEIIRRRSEAKELAEGVDQAARALASRIYVELSDKQPHAHAAIAVRPTPKLLVDEKDAVKWAISANRPDALKLNGSRTPMDERERWYDLGVKHTQRLRDEVLTLYNGKGVGMDTVAVRGTAFGAYNAIAELETYRRGAGVDRR